MAATKQDQLQDRRHEHEAVCLPVITGTEPGTDEVSTYERRERTQCRPSSAAILVISSSDANSTFSLYLCSSLLLRYSSRFSLFTSLSSVLANVLSTLPM